MPPAAPTPPPPQPPKNKPLWENRFSRPSPEDLLSELPKPASTLADALRSGLTSSHRFLERLTWQGIPWRWSFLFTPNPATEPAAAKNAGLSLYLIPAPTKLEVTLTLPDTSLSQVLAKKQPKTLKETLATASLVGLQRFVRWEPTAKSHTDEILAFIDQLIVLASPKPDPKSDAKTDAKPDTKAGSKR